MPKPTKWTSLCCSSTIRTSFPFSTQSLSQLITTLLSIESPHQALSFFNSISSTKAHIAHLYPPIIHITTRARMYPQATSLTKQLISHLGFSSIHSLLSFTGPKSTNDVVNVLIVSLSQLNLIEKALELFYGSKTMPGIVPCNWVLNGLLKSGRLDCFWKVYDDMLNRGQLPNVFTYNILINACRHDGDPRKALLLLDEMVRKKIGPTVHTYTTLICCLCENGNVEKAEEVFKMVKKPSLYAFNALMDGYFKNSDIQAAIELYGGILEEGLMPNEVTFGTLIDGLCKHGDVAGASRLFLFDMAEHGVTPNLAVYNCLIDGFFGLGCSGEAFKLYARMIKAGLPSDAVTYGILVKGLCSAGRIQEAFGLLSMMQQDRISVNSVVYNSVIDGCCKQGDMEKAMETCTRMSEEGIEPNVITFSLLIDGHCKKGEMDCAMGVYNEMVAKGYEPDVVTYTTLIDGYSKNGGLEKVSKLLIEMAEVDVEPNVVTATCLLDGLCREGRTMAAIKLFLKKTYSGRFKPNSKMYMALIHGLYRAAQYFKAGRFYKLMRESGLVPDFVTYIILMHGQCLFGYVLNAKMLQADMLKIGIIPDKWYISSPMVGHLFSTNQVKASHVGHRRFKASLSLKCHLLTRQPHHSNFVLIMHERSK